MDYLLPKGKKAHLRDVAVPVNPETKTANIKGTGDEVMVVTSCEDIAKATLALVLSKEKWPKYVNIIGEKTSWNKVLKQSEDIWGKFQVTKVSVEELKENIKKAQDDPNPMKKFFAEIDYLYATDCFNLPDKSSALFKDIKFTKVSDMLNRTKQLLV